MTYFCRLGYLSRHVSGVL